MDDSRHAIMTSMAIIPLSEDQRQKLIELLHMLPEPIARRGRLILAYGEGKATMQAAHEAGISRGRARYWKRQFFARGMDIFNNDDQKKPPIFLPAPEVHSPDAELIVTVDSAQLVEEKPTLRVPDFPSVQKFIGIQPEDSLVEAGKKVWTYHFALMLSHEQGTLVGEDIEELHDMRVATRRMRTAFDVFGEAFDLKVMKRFQKGLRGIGRRLGKVRDMDVILENAIHYQAKLEDMKRPGMEALLAAWRRTIDMNRAKLARHLQSEGYQRFKLEFNHFLQALPDDKGANKQGIEATQQIRDIVPALLYSRYARVRAYEAVVPKATVAQLHALRIEFKRFRYTLEYFREILGEGAGRAINEIKQYQDQLGELHDADVACQLVREILKGWEDTQAVEPIPERVSPEPIVTYLAYLHAERYRLMVGYPRLWAKFSRPEFRQILAGAISML